MDRCALFVDASYALADGALAVHGTRNRDSVSWDYAGLLKLLGGMSRDRTGLALLRCYWYDTSADGNRTGEHDSLADIPGVKLRLMKIRPNRKEGVEAEIRKDLTALARNHAISDVIIVSAEEDLAPVIAEVQDLGIRAILLTIATDNDWAASRALRQECDDLIEISPGHLRPYVDLISGAEPQLASAGYRELAADAHGVGEQHPAIEAPAQRLYPSPLPTLYEGAAQPQLASLSGHREQHSQDHPIQQAASAQQYQQADAGRELLGTGSDQGFRTSGYPTAESSRNHAGQVSSGYGQHSLSDEGRGGALPGNVPMGVAPGSAQLGAPGQNGLSGAGPASGQTAPRGGMPGRTVRQRPAVQWRLPWWRPAWRQWPGRRSARPAAERPASEWIACERPVRKWRSEFAVWRPGWSAAERDGTERHATERHDASGDRPVRRPAGTRHLHAGPVDAGPVDAGPVDAGPVDVSTANAGPACATSRPRISAERSPARYGAAVASAWRSATNRGKACLATGQPGQQRHATNPGISQSAVQPNGLAPVESQRSLAPERQLPVGNGVHYPAEGSAPYGGGPLQPAQFAGPPSAAYGRGSYGGPPAAPSAGLSVGDAVQSAHAEGFGFGEAVARDAPALWLEAVLARKPRMPSDLEARLLQGSALPIDSLLHDEVRHALRRGFWDALERSRH